MYQRVYILLLFVVLAIAAPAEDEFTQLPDAPAAMKTKSYSGYLTVSDSKALHYVYIESENLPENDPVVIWFNGGPGCSSLLGFMQEHGPFVMEDGATNITENPFPWNNKANMLYLESPAGVGYSVANKTSDYNTNDVQQSEDAMVALKAFYAKFPERLPNDLFISGESYGGIYVPYLAWQIYQNNLVAEFDNSTTAYPLKGILVGNGATDWNYDVDPAFAETVYNFNMISRKSIEYFRENNCKFYFNNFKNHTGPAGCEAVWDHINVVTGDMNWYDLYRQNYDILGEKADETKGPIVGKSNPMRLGSTVVDGKEMTYTRGFTMSEYTPFVKHFPSNPDNEVVYGDMMTDYMNREDVREALHIPSYLQPFQMCSNIIRYNLQEEASVWIYPILKAAGIRALFYSGDTDGAVPIYGSLQWIKELNWKTLSPWTQWKTDGQVSGYIEKMEGLDLVTVKGVGHMAPQWARKQMQSVFLGWIHDEL